MKRTTLAVFLLSFFPLFISVSALVKTGSGIRGPAFLKTAAPANISNSSTDSWSPLVGVDGSGAAYSAWIESPGKRVFYFSTNKGGSWSGPESVVQINNDTDSAGFPTFAVSSTGACHLIYQDGPDTSYDVLHLAYDKAWGALTNVSHNSGRSGDTSCAIHPVDKGLYAVWVDDTVRAGDLYLAYRNASGTWSQRQILPVGRGFTPSLSIDATGRAHLAWSTREGGLSTVWYSSNSTPQNSATWSPPVSVKNDTWEDFCYPKIDCDNQGNAYILWLDRTQGNKDVFLRKVAADGTPGEESNASQTPGASQEGVVAVNRRTGDVFVAWTENEDIYLNLYSGRWSGAGNLTNGVAPSNKPSIAVDSSGLLHVVYAQVSGGNWEIMYLATRTPTTSTSTTTTSIPAKIWPPLDLALETQLQNDQAAKSNTLTWHRNPGNRLFTVDGYRIYRKPAGTPDGEFTFIASVSTETSRYADGGLPLSPKFAYRMTTFIQNGEESEPSETVTEANLFPPLNAACRNIMNNSLFRREKINIISWQDNPLNDAGRVAQLNIYRKRSDQEDSAYQQIGVIAGDVHEFQDRKVPFGEKYVYVITTVDPAGNESGRSNPAKEGS